MKKILVLTHEYYPFHGGVGRYCYNLFKYFHSDEYFVLSDQKELPDGPQYMSRPLLSLYWKPRWQKGLRLVRRLVNEKNIGVIFTPHILPLGIIAYYIHSLTKIPYVVSLHGMDINLALEHRKKMTLSILNSASCIIVNSLATKRIIEGLAISTPIEVITPILEEDKLAVDKSAHRNLQKKYAGKKIILTIGRLVKRKGHDTMIRAMPDIVRRIPEAFYCIVGAGPDLDYLASLIAELHMQDHVEILSDVQDNELGAYYAQASIFAMPTRKIGADVEGFGIVYLEAAYFGLPIIAGNTGCEVEALGEGPASVIVSGERIHEVVEAVTNILLDTELAAFIGGNAKKHIAALPAWKEQSYKLRDIFSRL